MAGISHGDMLELGKTVMPMRIEHIKSIVGQEVDETYEMYRLKGTPNSADFSFVRIGERGYIDLRFNPHWVHQFHLDEWPAIEKRLDESPFVKEFGGRQRTVISEKKWDRQYKSRYERTRSGNFG